jgi:ribosomal protein S18 acetylase RimI-like enzyme
MQLELRLSDYEEIEIGLNLLKKAAYWLKSKNIDYWQSWINPQELYIDWIKQGFKNGQFYFVLNNFRIIGMFRLQWDDELFWGKQENDSGYIHSFTIDRDYYGQGLGKQVLLMIEDLCVKNNKHFLRLDCGVNVTGLCKYYSDFGFNSVGEVLIHNERLVLFEKRIFEKN